MSSVMQRESRSLHAALEAADPRAALRDAVQQQLRGGQSRASTLQILDEFSEKLEPDQRDFVLEIMDLLEGWASQYAIHSFFEGLPEEAPPGRGQ